MTGSRQIPVAEGLFTWPADEPRLIGARCEGCGLVGFPAGPACQRCGGTEVTQTLLSDRGTLWTFTTQDFRPPSPPYDGADTAETFQPYALGYVELPGEVMVEARLTRARPGPAGHRPADAAGDRALHRPRRRHGGPDVRVRARGREHGQRTPGGMMEAVIVGVGLHPFGRFPGKSAMDMAADAVRAALADAGVGWPQVQAGFVGSLEVYNPDAIVGRLGLTGMPLRGVFNGCATAGTAVAMAARAIETGEHDLTIAIGMDKHPRGAFAADPSVAGLPAWYGQTGMFLTTHFFGMKINRYMHDHGITHQTPGPGGGQELPQRVRQRERVAAHPAVGGGDPRLPGAELPAPPVHVLRA